MKARAPRQGQTNPRGKMRVTAAKVARWMLTEVGKEGWLTQYDAAGEIRDIFGARFTYYNRNGNLAIQPEVLEEFRKISARTVVWERASRSWSLREAGDPPGRQVD